MAIQDFHSVCRTMILSTGDGLFEYFELVKFFEKLNTQIKGDKQSNIPEDRELIDCLRTELLKYPKGIFTTPRGVKFQAAETGTAYHYENCNDPLLDEYNKHIETLKEKIKQRQEMLQTIPKEGMDMVNIETGESYKVYPPYKTSNSSFKITMK